MFKALSLSNVFKVDTGVAALMGGMFGGFVDALYGLNHRIFLLLLFLVIVFDWASGIKAAKKDGTYSSEYGIDGVLRSVVLLLLPVFGNLIDIAFQSPGVIFYGIAIALIYHTWKSFTANSIRAGWDKWIPEFVFNSVESELKAKMNRSLQRQQVDNSTNQADGGTK